MGKNTKENISIIYNVHSLWTWHNPTENWFSSGICLSISSVTKWTPRCWGRKLILRWNQAEPICIPLPPRWFEAIASFFPLFLVLNTNFSFLLSFSLFDEDFFLLFFFLVYFFDFFSYQKKAFLSLSLSLFPTHSLVNFSCVNLFYSFGWKIFYFFAFFWLYFHDKKNFNLKLFIPLNLGAGLR